MGARRAVERRRELAQGVVRGVRRDRHHGGLADQLAEAAGFKLAGRSEINANPKDARNYEKGVWTLPPVLANGDKDRGAVLAIGESDRMTLKFVKPAN